MPDPALDGELTPYLDVRRAGRRVADVVAELTDAELDALGSVAMVMFRPDAVRDRRALPVLDALATDHGISPVRLAIRCVDPPAFDHQYVTELGVIAPGLWLHHRVAAAGPTVFVIVAGPAPDGRSLATALDDLKGASSPASETDTTTLRSRFGRPSSFHVVLHTSEDAGDFLQGAAEVFGWATVRGVLREVAAGVTRHPREEDLRRLIAEIGATERRDVFDLALSLKRRIVAALRLAAAEPEHAGGLPRVIGRLDALDRLYEACDLGTGALFVDRRARFMELARSERSELAALVDELERDAASGRAPAEGGPVGERWRAADARDTPTRLAWASWFLAGHEPYDLDDGTLLAGLLERSGIALGPGEDTLLAAGLAVDINPDATFAGRRTYPLDAG